MKACAILLVLPILAVNAFAQGEVSRLEGTGGHTKYLTPNNLDRWLFDGEEGETIIASITTREFDPVIDLTLKTAAEPDQVVVPEVNDEGIESRFSIRLPDKGQYSIRIHAFKFKGGGNYRLDVQRFKAQPLAIGKAVTGAFDAAGKACFYFPGVKDQFVLPEPKGTSGPWQVLDLKGRGLASWSGAVRTAESGEHTLLLSGPAGNRFELLLRQARQHDLSPGPAATPGQLQQGEMDVWSFPGKPGDFRLIEIEKKGQLVSRVVSAPLEKKPETRLPEPGERPEIEFLPVASGAGHQRFALLLGREGRYQLQVVASSPVAYNLTMTDPTLPLERDKEAQGALAVGGAAFYSFQAAPGQLLHASLTSQKFVPLLRIYDPAGRALEASAEPDDLASRLTHMALQAGLYRVQVASLGDGGGGEFRLALQEEKLKSIELGGREKGSLQPDRTYFWSFSGQEGKTVFISVRSSTCSPTLSVRNPDGVILATDDNPGQHTDSLLPVKLPALGRYTLWISSRRGAGEYTLRLIDGD